MKRFDTTTMLGAVSTLGAPGRLSGALRPKPLSTLGAPGRLSGALRPKPLSTLGAPGRLSGALRPKPLRISLIAALPLVVGCGSGMTRYTPQVVAPGEIVLAYDDGYKMYADEREIASGNTWGGLTDYVHCVPRAKAHARDAETTGGAAVGLSIAGATVGLASLGSLSGLAFVANENSKDYNPALGGAIIGAGVAAAVTGVVLAAVGRRLKPIANGNAIDAMNYYNDELGQFGRSCKNPKAEIPGAKPAQSGGDAPAEKPAGDTPPGTILIPEGGSTTSPRTPPPPPPPSSTSDI